MTELMEVLYNYAQRQLLPSYLCLDPFYAESDLCAARQTEAVRAALTEQGQVHLKKLLDELELVQAARDRAAFRAGFSLALELARV